MHPLNGKPLVELDFVLASSRWNLIRYMEIIRKSHLQLKTYRWRSLLYKRRIRIDLVCMSLKQCKHVVFRPRVLPIPLLLQWSLPLSVTSLFVNGISQGLPEFLHSTYVEQNNCRKTICSVSCSARQEFIHPSIQDSIAFHLLDSGECGLLSFFVDWCCCRLSCLSFVLTCPSHHSVSCFAFLCVFVDLFCGLRLPVMLCARRYGVVSSQIVASVWQPYRPRNRRHRSKKPRP